MHFPRQTLLFIKFSNQLVEILKSSLKPHFSLNSFNLMSKHDVAQMYIWGVKCKGGILLIYFIVLV